MKGILFSSDFVMDNNGNERLLEINTDTGFISTILPLIDFSEFFTVLSNNYITKLKIFYKEEIHSNFVNVLEDAVNSNAPFITTFEKNIVAENNIFPTIPNEDTDTFILRLAYDESAILDSEYAKGTLELLKLFADNGDTGSVCNFYHSSSVDGFYNTLDGTINDSNNLPDFVTKTIIERRKEGKFYKVGKNDLSVENRIDDFIQSVSNDTTMIQQYHFNSNSINEDNKITSIRSYKIVYGSNLDIISLIDYTIESIFDLPIDLSTEIDSTKIDNLLSPKHYYEFATNFTKPPQKTKGGLLGTHEIVMSDDSLKELQNIQVGDVVKSYFISGSPMRDNVEEVFNWVNSGNTLPNGSYTTSSFVENVFSASVDNNLINELKIGNDTIYASVSNTFLVYQTDTNTMQFKKSLKIDPSNDLLVNNQGNVVTIDENNLYILDEDTHKVVEINVEDVDTYLIAGTDNFLNTTFIITHNWCFIAGTQIHMADGSQKNIEDIQIGDQILSYNEQEKKNEIGIVGDLKKHEVSKIIKITFDNSENTISSTPEHPFYIINKGWIELQNLMVGDECLDMNGNVCKINTLESIDELTTVYNLLNVSPNHTFYANNILVHNK